RHVLGPAVLVLQVVGMLPDIEAENGDLVVHERTVLIRPTRDAKLSVGDRQPGPPASELGRCGVRELLLELREVPERPLDRVGQRAAGLSTAAPAGRGQDPPEQCVVVMAATGVAGGGTDVFGTRAAAAQQLLQPPRTAL